MSAHGEIWMSVDTSPAPRRDSHWRRLGMPLDGWQTRPATGCCSTGT
jgi:hypothetical protein